MKNVSILVAIGVNAEGFREVLGVAEVPKEDKASWQGFMRYLKSRGLTGVKSVIGDLCLGLVEALAEFFPMRLINAARCIFIATCGRWFPAAR